METVEDFEDMLSLLHEHGVEYLIVGGLAFVYHAKPRYTKDIDLWIGPADDNIRKANLALAEFGSPVLLDVGQPTQVVQIGVAPNRIDLIVGVGELDFASAWARRIVGTYGGCPVNWIDLDSLITIKQSIPLPKHQEDARVLREVKRLREEETL